MSANVGQTLLVMGGALLLALSTVRLVRKGLLSIRYGIGWLIVSAVGIVGAPVLTLISSEVIRLGFTPTGFSLGIFFVFLGLFCLQLSISLSGLHHAVQDLSEHAARTEARLRAIEEAER